MTVKTVRYAHDLDEALAIIRRERHPRKRTSRTVKMPTFSFTNAQA